MEKIKDTINKIKQAKTIPDARLEYDIAARPSWERYVKACMKLSTPESRKLNLKIYYRETQPMHNACVARIKELEKEGN